MNTTPANRRIDHGQVAAKLNYAALGQKLEQLREQEPPKKRKQIGDVLAPVAARLCALESWLQSAGQVARNTRLSKYKNDISVLADPEKLQNLRDHFSEPELRELFFTFTEVHELHTIFSTLRAQHIDILKARFLEVITGPASSTKEKPSNEVDPKNWTGRIDNPTIENRSPCPKNDGSIIPSSKRK